MTLRRKLIILLSCFALFVAGVTTATISAVQVYIDTAFERFNLWTTEAGRIDRLRSELSHHGATLRAMLDDPDKLSRYSTRQSPLFLELDAPEVVRQALPPLIETALRLAADQLKSRTSQFLEAARAGRIAEARALLETQIVPLDVPDLERRLAASRPAMEAWRHESDQQLVRSGERVLMLAVGVVVGAAVLLLLSAQLVGRWLILPIADLQRATEEYRRGRLDFRTQPRSTDELGELAVALNTMAESLSEADRVLQASERKSRALFENLRDALVICDIDGVVVECRDSEPPVLSAAAGGDAARRSIRDVLPGASTGAFDWTHLVREVAGGGRHRRGEDVVLLESDPRTDSEPLVVDYVAFAIALGDRTCAAIVLRDARERHRLQRRVREGETMEAIGRFAGGIAHDFNNLLTGAIGSLSLIKEQKDDARAPDRLNTALQSCWQAAGLSRRLLHFARGGRGRPQTLALAEVVETVLASQDEAFFQGLQVQRQLDPQLQVRMDKDELTQVVLNLIVNAREAMPDGGTLSVSVERAASPLASSQTGGGNLAVLRVSDSGGGIPPDIRRRIFEPFFTTKHRSQKRGTGLGLSIVYTAVRSAGGDITVESEPGRGTTFSASLPEAFGAPDTPAPTSEPVSAPRAGQTVLVVDDDPLVLRTCADALQAWGCRVLTAGCVEEARRQMAASDDPAPAAALIDVALPDGSGYDLAREWLAARPALRVAVMTGFSQEPVPAALEPLLAARLDKPFSSDALLRLFRAT
ncbi:MAG: HAMP domain-containing protein [Phycisphaerales bacterium]|nr:HAMP domain-containing protein [Phycisphaerales bacterium]